MMATKLSHPWYPGDLLFLVHFRRRRHRHRLRRRSANTFQLSGKILEANFFKPYMVVDLWVWDFFLPVKVTT